MKYASLMAAVPRILNARDAEDYVCGPTILKLLCEKWGLKPFLRLNKLTAYDRNDIDLAIDRLKSDA